MAITVAVANQKGGVGKTTTTINLMHALAERGKKVLGVDADAQASLTLYCGQDPVALQEQERTLYHSLVQNKPMSSILIAGNPALIPASIILSKADRELMVNLRYTDMLLRDKLREVAAHYDFILVDCPPTLTLLTSNALAMADLVLIPVKTDYLSIMGIPLLLEEIEVTQRRTNRDLQILGVLPTLFQSRLTHDNEALEGLRRITQEKGLRLFDPIPRSTSYDQAAADGLPTIVRSPKTRGVEEYYKLADEILHHA